MVRETSKVPRENAPGPDGVWPYLLYVPPAVCFEYGCRLIQFMGEEWKVVEGLYDAHLLVYNYTKKGIGVVLMCGGQSR